MFLSFFIVTINYRAVAQANYLYTFLTDISLTALNWSVLKRVSDAQCISERLGYMIGGALGAQLAILVTLRLLGK